MKLLRANDQGFVFQVGKREKRLLFDLLKLYPRVPAAYQRLSKSGLGSGDEENQRLLEEALAAHREENRRQVLAMLNEPGRFIETETGVRFTLSPEQVEWLLQVLNDVRVGSWLALGSPDTEAEEKLELDEQTAPHFFAMQAAGFFEMALVEALSGRSAG